MDVVKLPELTRINGHLLTAASGTLMVEQVDGTPGPAIIYGDEDAVVVLDDGGLASWVQGEPEGWVEAGHTYDILQGTDVVSRFEAVKATTTDSGLDTRVTAVEGGKAEKSRLPINVKDQGAAGNGTTDDTAAIAAAVATGRPVYFPAGTYLVTALQPLSNQTLFGDGPGVTTIKLKNATNGNLLTASSKSYVHVSNLTLDGNQANQTAGGVIVYTTVTNFSLLNVEVKNAWNNGVLINGTSSDGRIEGCNIHDSGSAAILAALLAASTSGCHGIALSGTSGVADSGPVRIAIVGNILRDNYSSGVNASQAARCTITGNTISLTATDDSGYGGVRLSNGCKSTTVSANTLVNCSRGVFITPDSGSGPSEFNVVSGNYIEGSYYQGILLEASYNAIVGNTIKNCCAGNLDGGIRVSSQDTDSGHPVVTNTVHCTIVGNIIIDTTGIQHQYGIKVTDGASSACDFLTIVGNTIKGFVTSALISTGAATVVKNNATTQSLSQASGTTLTPREHSDYLTLTGGGTVNTIVGVRIGREVTFHLSAAVTFTHSATLSLAGSVNFVGKSGDTITLICKGTNSFEEKCRMVS